MLPFPEEIHAMSAREKLRYIAIIEARMTSSRLPGKMMMDVGGKPSLQILIERLLLSRGLDGIVVATTAQPTDNPICALCSNLGIMAFRGSEENVLERVLCAAKSAHADVIVEITGDCTLLDPTIIAEAIIAYKKSDADFVANCVSPPHYPPGMDARIFATSLLAELAVKTQNPADLEHVSLYFWKHPDEYKLLNLHPPVELYAPDLFIALDNHEDLNLIRMIHDNLNSTGQTFGCRDIIEFLRKNPVLAQSNRNALRKKV